MPTPLSCYILTHNSASRLAQVLESLDGIVDDLVIVDSGSTDGSREIAAGFGARVIARALDNFTAQRSFAAASCVHDWVLSIDSDEVVSPALAQRLRTLKASGLLSDADAPDAYAIRRDWYVLQQRVRCFYPSHCPDFPIRLFLKAKATYIAERHVHESMAGFSRAEPINEPLLHYTCDSVDQLYGKMNLYTRLAALDLLRHGRPSLLRVMVMPRLVWAKWYLVNGGWKDGVVGVILARYAFDSVYQKHIKARYDGRPANVERS